MFLMIISKANFKLNCFFYFSKMTKLKSLFIFCINLNDANLMLSNQICITKSRMFLIFILKVKMFQRKKTKFYFGDWNAVL